MGSSYGKEARGNMIFEAIEFQVGERKKEKVRAARFDRKNKSAHRLLINRTDRILTRCFWVSPPHDWSDETEIFRESVWWSANAVPALRCIQIFLLRGPVVRFLFDQKTLRKRPISVVFAP